MAEEFKVEPIAVAEIDASAKAVLGEVLEMVTPTDNLLITENGENINVATYATVTVNVQ